MSTNVSYTDVLATVRGAVSKVEKEFTMLPLNRLSQTDLVDISEAYAMFVNVGHKLSNLLENAKHQDDYPTKSLEKVFKLNEAYKREHERGSAVYWHVPMTIFNACVIANPSTEEYRDIVSGFFEYLYDDVMMELIRGERKVDIFGIIGSDDIEAKYKNDKVAKWLIVKLLTETKEYLLG